MSKMPVLVLELTDRKDSSFALEETMNSSRPIFLNAPGKAYLPTTSVEKQPDGSYRKLRYIAGCNTPYKDEQDRDGIPTNPQEDIIEFENGSLTVVRAGRTIGLYEYLKKCEWNENNEKRPESAIVKFRELNSQEDATKSINQTMLEMKALQVVHSLGIETQSGYEWDAEKIDSLCGIFLIGGLDSYEEKVQQLSLVAKARPDYFLQAINNQTNGIRIDVAAAIQFNVVSTSGESASFMDSGRKFYTFKTKGKDSRVSELVDYFLTASGQKDYKLMIINTNAAKQKAAEAVS